MFLVVISVSDTYKAFGFFSCNFNFGIFFFVGFCFRRNLVFCWLCFRNINSFSRYYIFFSIFFLFSGFMNYYESVVSVCWELGSTMSTYVSEVPPDNKTRKKTNEEASPSWSSLPDSVVLSCVARVSRLDHPTVSPELCRTRLLIGCTEPSFYVCLRIVPDPTPGWFILTRNRRLKSIPSNPYQPLESSSFMVVD